MKNGFLGTEIADFISILVFVLFVVVMLFLFKLKGAGVTATITSAFDKGNSMNDLLNILHTNADENRTIEDLIISLDQKALVSNMSYLYETLNLTNPELSVFNDRGIKIFSIRRGFFEWGKKSGILSSYQWESCTPNAFGLILPYKKAYLTVVFEECAK